MRLKIVQQRALVPVRLNGTGPFYFLFDTGADATMVQAKVVERLNLPAAPATRIRIFAGEVELPQADLEWLEVGNRSMDGLRIVSADLERLFGLPSGVDGILGQDFLASHDYLISYRKKYLVFDDGDLRSLIYGKRVRVERRAGKFYLSIRRNGRMIRLLLDSGIPYPVIFSAPDRPPKLDIVGCSTRELKAESPAGGRALRSCRLAGLELGDLRLENLPVYMTERLTGERHFEDGILPLALFDAIYFNNSEGFVILNPKQ